MNNTKADRLPSDQTSRMTMPPIGKEERELSVRQKHQGESLNSTKIEEVK
jgi:hypothetical protein